MAGFQPLVDELFGERSGACQRFAERCRTCEWSLAITLSLVPV
jgi:hypothetical protein